MNCDNINDILSIPRGNDFRLHICGGDVVPGSPDASFDDVDGLVAYLVRFPGIRIEVEHETSGSDIILTVPAAIQRCTTYGVEMTGTYGEHAWRWKAKVAFRIVDSNCESSMQGNETFGVETYYLRDILKVEVLDDTMYFITHGHAHLGNMALTLQDTKKTTVYVDKDTLIITEKD